MAAIFRLGRNIMLLETTRQSLLSSCVMIAVECVRNTQQMVSALKLMPGMIRLRFHAFEGGDLINQEFEFLAELG